MADDVSIERRLVSRKWLLVAVVVLVVAVVGVRTVQTILAPNWEFKASADKAVYRLGENVTVTTTLKNNGYVAHSFSAFYEDPIEVTVGKGTALGGTWYSPNQKSVHKVSVPPGQTVERIVVWNQTDLNGELVEPGAYTIWVFIRDEESLIIHEFEAVISITITE